MRQLFGILGLCLLGAWSSMESTQAVAAPAIGADFTCKTYVSKIREGNVRYCLQRSRPDLPQQPGEPVVYLMHGIFGSADSWKIVGYDRALKVVGAETDYPAVTFVVFDTGGFSFFSDVAGISQGPWAYETWFVDEFVPHIEKVYNLCSTAACRGIVGTSMGGFGALKTAFKHPELFHFVAVNSPALSPFEIHKPDADWLKYWSRQTIGANIGMVLLNGVRLVFPDQALADANDPIWLAEHFEKPENYPPLYMDVGDRDEYGFNEGFGRFMEVLKRRTYRVESHLVPGAGHLLSLERAIGLFHYVAQALKAPAPATPEAAATPTS
jgi:S-formylglutathione hydrolase FrmB